MTPKLTIATCFLSLCALFYGYTQGLHDELASALVRAQAAERDRDLLLACMNGKPLHTTSTAQPELIHCHPRTTRL